MEAIEILKKGAKQFNIDLSDKQVTDFFRFKDLLLEWNSKMNLTSIQEENEVVIKHFLDSISCITLNLFKPGDKIIDVGTGAGFPSVPLKIADKDLEITLLDSLNKRLIFLDEVIEQLGLTKISTLHGRAEDVARDLLFREKFDISISRAVAHLSVLSEYCLPFVKLGGYFISMKGPNVEQELAESENAINILGGEIIDIKSIVLPYTEIQHSIISIKKVKQSPTKYPRKAGTPAKSPLKK